MKATLWVLALFVGYKILRFYVGFWLAAGLVAALVLVVLLDDTDAGGFTTERRCDAPGPAS
jgi:hypothetical protein